MKDECINCGAWKGLHHYETNQCPHNGQEASLGKLQEWDNTVYQEDNTAELRAKIAEQAATIARLTENLENANIATTSLQHQNVKLIGENTRLTADAKLADMAWTDNQAALNKQAEEIRTLKQELETIKSCKHMHVKIHSRLYRPSTREEPAEYEYKAECKDCGELFSADDVDEWAEVEE